MIRNFYIARNTWLVKHWCSLVFKYFEFPSNFSYLVSFPSGFKAMPFKISHSSNPFFLHSISFQSQRCFYLHIYAVIRSNCSLLPALERRKWGCYALLQPPWISWRERFEFCNGIRYVFLSRLGRSFPPVFCSILDVRWRGKGLDLSLWLVGLQVGRNDLFYTFLFFEFPLPYTCSSSWRMLVTKLLFSLTFASANHS